MSIFRGFIAVEINASPSIVKLIDEIEKTGEDIKTVEPCNMHVTLKFLGDTEESSIDDIEDVMKRISENESSFNVKLRGLGFFPDERYIRVVYVNVEDNGRLSNISDKLNDELTVLGYEKEEKHGFQPHLTVARVKRLKNKEGFLDLKRRYVDFLFDEFIVDRFMLKKSVLTQRGPVYTTLRTVCLK